MEPEGLLFEVLLLSYDVFVTVVRDQLVLVCLLRQMVEDLAHVGCHGCARHRLTIELAGKEERVASLLLAILDVPFLLESVHATDFTVGLLERGGSN